MATGPGGREAILKAGIDATKAKTGSEEFARAMNNMVQSAQQAWLALGRLDARLDNITRHTPGIRAMASAIRDLARATEQHAAAAARVMSGAAGGAGAAAGRPAGGWPIVPVAALAAVGGLRPSPGQIGYAGTPLLGYRGYGSIPGGPTIHMGPTNFPPIAPLQLGFASGPPTYDMHHEGGGSYAHPSAISRRGGYGMGAAIPGAMLDSLIGGAAGAASGIRAAAAAASSAAGAMRTFAFSTLPVAYSLYKVVEVTTSLERQQLRLQQVLGDKRGEDFFTQVKQWAIDYPFQVGDITEASIQLITRGLIPTRNEMQFLSDMAATYGQSMNDTLRKIVAVTRGEYDPARGLGLDIFGKEGIVTITNGTRTASAQINNLSKVLGAFQDVLGKTVGGASAKLINSFSGSLVNLVDYITLFVDKAARTGGFNDVMRDMALALSEATQNQENVDLLATSLRGMAESIRAVGRAIMFWQRVRQGGLPYAIAGPTIAEMGSWRAQQHEIINQSPALAEAVYGPNWKEVLARGSKRDLVPGQASPDTINRRAKERKALTDEERAQQAYLDQNLAAMSDHEMEAARKYEEWRAEVLKVREKIEEDIADMQKPWSAELTTYGDFMSDAWDGATNAVVNFRTQGTQAIEDFGEAVLDMLIKIAAQWALMPLFNGIANFLPGAGIIFGQGNGAAVGPATANNPMPKQPSMMAGVTINNYASDRGVTVQPTMTSDGLTLDVLVGSLETRMAERTARGGGLYPMLRGMQQNPGAV